MVQTIREAMLRPEYADMYPPVKPGVWLAAAEIGASMLFWHIRNIGGALPEERLLKDDHFRFRGGWTRGSETVLHTRATDADDAVPARRP